MKKRERRQQAADKTNGKIYAMPATIGSWGWFEALLTVVRNQEKDDKQKDIDKEVGKLIEYYINEKLDEKALLIVVVIIFLRQRVKLILWLSPQKVSCCLR